MDFVEPYLPKNLRTLKHARTIDIGFAPLFEQLIGISNKLELCSRFELIK